jgi:primosomal protein N''
MFYIDKDKFNPDSMSIQAKSSGQLGVTIKNGDILEGTDGFLAWEISEAVDDIRKSIDSPQTRQFVAEIESLASECNKKLQEIDWERLGEDLKRETQSLVNDINQMIESEKFQLGVEELKTKIKRVEGALKEVGESEEAGRLLDALEDLYEKLNDELNKKE